MARTWWGLCAAAVLACSGATGGSGATDGTEPLLGAQGACSYVETRGSCVSYRDALPGIPAQMKAACDATGGVFAESCPGGALAGRCVIPTPAYVGEIALYAPRWSGSAGATMCMNGAWIAGNVMPSEDAVPTVVSCSNPWDGTCADTSGPMTATLRTAVERFCTGNENRVLDGACATTGRTGTCTMTPGMLRWETRHYDASAIPADRASCLANEGAWTDG